MILKILKTPSKKFKYKHEFLNLHKRILSLDSNINLHRNFEKKINNIKLKNIEDNLDNIKFSEKFFKKRNIRILENIQKNNFHSYNLSLTTYESL